MNAEKTTLSKSLKDLMNKGADAIKRNNYPYAIALLTTVVESAPDCNEARNLLRMAEIKQFETKGDPRIKFFITMPYVIFYLLKAHLESKKSDWISVISYCEKALRRNPFSKLALFRLGDAARICAKTQLAIDSYEQVRRQSPKNVKALRMLARIYLKNDELDKARRYFEEIVHISPHDSEANKGIKDIDAMKTIQSGGWDEEDSSYRSKIKDEKQAILYEQEARIGRSESDIDDLVTKKLDEFEKQPDDVNIIKDLGRLYSEKGDFDSSIEAYEKAASINPGDFAIRELITEVKLLRIDKMVFDIKESSKAASGKADESRIKELLEEKDKLLLEEREQRVKHYPNNLIYRFDLGESYFKINEIDKAVEQFQVSVNEPRKRVFALNYMGLCFHRKKLYDLAAKQFIKAQEQLRDMNELKKEVIYNLGCLYEETGEKDKALDQFQIIYEVDIGYKDIRKKIEQK